MMTFQRWPRMMLSKWCLLYVSSTNFERWTDWTCVSFKLFRFFFFFSVIIVVDLNGLVLALLQTKISKFLVRPGLCRFRSLSCWWFWKKKKKKLSFSVFWLCFILSEIVTVVFNLGCCSWGENCWGLVANRGSERKAIDWDCKICFSLMMNYIVPIMFFILRVH